VGKEGTKSREEQQIKATQFIYLIIQKHPKHEEEEISGGRKVQSLLRFKRRHRTLVKISVMSFIYLLFHFCFLC